MKPPRKPKAARAARSAAAPAGSDPHERLRRVLFLVPYAVRHPGIPVKDLARKCGVGGKELLEDSYSSYAVTTPEAASDDACSLKAREYSPVPAPCTNTTAGSGPVAPTGSVIRASIDVPSSFTVTTDSRTG